MTLLSKHPILWDILIGWCQTVMQSCQRNAHYHWCQTPPHTFRNVFLSCQGPNLYVWYFGIWYYIQICTSSLYSLHLCAKEVVKTKGSTCRILEISHGRAPLWASSTIFCLVVSGNGLPLTNTPPSWFTPLWPKHRQGNIVGKCQSLENIAIIFASWQEKHGSTVR